SSYVSLPAGAIPACSSSDAGAIVSLAPVSTRKTASYAPLVEPNGLSATVTWVSPIYRCDCNAFPLRLLRLLPRPRSRLRRSCARLRPAPGARGNRARLRRRPRRSDGRAGGRGARAGRAGGGGDPARALGSGGGASRHDRDAHRGDDARAQGDDG